MVTGELLPRQWISFSWEGGQEGRSRWAAGRAQIGRRWPRLAAWSSPAPRCAELLPTSPQFPPTRRFPVLLRAAVSLIPPLRRDPRLVCCASFQTLCAQLQGFRARLRRTVVTVRAQPPPRLLHTPPAPLSYPALQEALWHLAPLGHRGSKQSPLLSLSHHLQWQRCHLRCGLRFQTRRHQTAHFWPHGAGCRLFSAWPDRRIFSCLCSICEEVSETNGLSHSVFSIAGRNSKNYTRADHKAADSHACAAILFAAVRLPASTASLSRFLLLPRADRLLLSFRCAVQLAVGTTARPVTCLDKCPVFSPSLLCRIHPRFLLLRLHVERKASCRVAARLIENGGRLKPPIGGSERAHLPLSRAFACRSDGTAGCEQR